MSKPNGVLIASFVIENLVDPDIPIVGKLSRMDHVPDLCPEKLIKVLVSESRTLRLQTLSKSFDVTDLFYYDCL